ncbi:MAG: hypothetical protein A3F40_04050 [Chlamydiae bacterium RIFCSPHIGHO2_12_FULL_27_8]|nr:MAG: hypothetical protein A3F40_04050 [Chlamydiae bacterium RIFCSPHIGHO2_12_FULL_27_8]
MKVFKNIKEYFCLLIMFFKSKNKKLVYLSLLSILLFSIIEVLLLILINKWNLNFFNSLENGDFSTISKHLLIFAAYAGCLVSVYTIVQFLISFLSFKWRKFLTSKFFDLFFNNNKYYHLLQKKMVDNPDQRFSQDLEYFTTMSITVFAQLLKELFTFIIFIPLLFNLSKNFRFLINDKTINLPGYLLWIAMLYGILVNFIIVKVGKPLIKLNFEYEKVEANFRFSLARIRYTVEEIAFLKGEKFELKLLKKSFINISSNFYNLLKYKSYLNIAQKAHWSIETIVPFIAASPMFFSKLITVGVLMQINNAFTIVSTSITRFSEIFQDIAHLQATKDRVYEFFNILKEKIENKNSIIFTNKNYIECKNVTIFSEDNTKMIENINLKIDEGDRLLIYGKSGKGKTTFLRTLAGLWSNFEGEIKISNHNSTMFIPQKPYLPFGNLIDAFVYPNPLEEIDLDKLKHLMNILDLNHLYNELYANKKWEGILSIGEVQRINFFRILYNQPKIVILDEPTASLDSFLELSLLQKLFDNLDKSTIFVMVSHSTIVRPFFNKFLNISNINQKETFLSPRLFVKKHKKKFRSQNLLIKK